MSITFSLRSASGDEPLQKVYAHEEFPELCRDAEEMEIIFASDPAYERDEKGYFCLQSAWPSLNMSQSTAHAVLALLSIDAEQEGWCGSFHEPHLVTIIRRIVWVINSPSELSTKTMPPSQDGNFFSGGLSIHRLRERLKALLNLLLFAQRNRLAIVWG